MLRIISFIMIVILLSGFVYASPYPLYIWEIFEDEELSEDFHWLYLVNEPPSDPARSYLIVEAPSWNGTNGLSMIQGTDGYDPYFEFYLYCRVCGGGSFRFEIAAAPGREFGSFRVEVATHPPDPIVYVIDAPGEYEFENPADVLCLAVTMSGHDVIVDEIHFYDVCDCYIPAESSSWGDMKSSYR